MLKAQCQLSTVVKSGIGGVLRDITGWFLCIFSYPTGVARKLYSLAHHLPM